MAAPAWKVCPLPRIAAPGLLALALLGQPVAPTAARTASAPNPQPLGESFAPTGQMGSASGSIDNAGQRDRYGLEVTQGQLLEVRVTRTSGITLSPNIVVLDPTGQQEASAGPGVCTPPEAFPERRLASSGTYTLVVSGCGGTRGRYTVSLVLR
jgi:hypothetical protein